MLLKSEDYLNIYLPVILILMFSMKIEYGKMLTYNAKPTSLFHLCLEQMLSIFYDEMFL